MNKREVTAQYVPPKVFRVQEYATKGWQFTLARKELQAYAFLCRQQEAREWLEAVLGTKFPDNPQPRPEDHPTIQKSYKSDLFPMLRDGMRLCNVLNKMKPNVVKVNNSTGKPFLMMENINFFLGSLVKDLGLPTHLLFLPLDLHERKNMPKVVYCLHELARVAFANKWVTFQIVDKTGQYEFGQEELRQAAIDLAEIEQVSKGSRLMRPTAPPPVDQDKLAREAQEAENKRHNAEQIANNRHTFVLNQEEPPRSIIIEGWSKAEAVTGQRDQNYSLCVEILFMNGEKKTEYLSFNTGTHDWEQSAATLLPDKPIRELVVYPIFADPHKGKVWFDKFGCFENLPPSSLIQFLDNPSFEIKADKEDKAASWVPEGDYERTAKAFVGAGAFSAKISAGGNAKSTAARQTVPIHQNTPIPLIIEAYLKAEGLDATARCGVVVDVKFKDDTVQKGIALSFESGTHDWVRRQITFNPPKPIQKVDFRCVLENAKSGAVFFDHCGISQEAFKQYVRNPGFEIRDGQDESVAAGWERVEKGYQRNFREHCVYGCASIELKSASSAEICSARQVVSIQQRSPKTLFLEAYSKAVEVSGDADANYAVVIDWDYGGDGSTSPKKERTVLQFSTGTHDWERKQIELMPIRPVKSATVLCVFSSHSGVAYFDNVTISEKFEFGEDRFFQMQRLLRSTLGENDNWIEELQELKRRIAELVRSNHVLERELALLDKRIELFIKNKGNVEEVIKASKRVFKLFRATPNKKDALHSPREASAAAKAIRSNAEIYSQVLFLLQAKPKYLGKLLYLITPEQMENFLETVILTLFGDATSPREEYLLLQLMQEAIQHEIAPHKVLGRFLESSTVITKMIVTYNRRRDGEAWLNTTLAALMSNLISVDHLDFELLPLAVHLSLIQAEESRTGRKTTQKRVNTNNEALAIPEVKTKIMLNTVKLLEKVDMFLTALVSGVRSLPYGLRWTCKTIAESAEKAFNISKVDTLQQVVGYFVYYRFMNPALVSPDAYGLLDAPLTPPQTKNVIILAKLLQCVFNGVPYGKEEFKPLNDYIAKSKPRILEFCRVLINVPDPQDHLMVDQYVALVSGTRPVVTITYDELYATHEILIEHLPALTAADDDPLAQLMRKMGKLPSYDMQDSADRELVLTLRDPNPAEVEKKLQRGIAAEEKARALCIDLLHRLPLENRPASTTLLDVLDENLSDKASADLQKQITALLVQIGKEKSLETTKVAALLLEQVVREVENMAVLRVKRQNEIKRLRVTLESLEKDHSFLQEQLSSYETYLHSAKEQNVRSPRARKKAKKLKFSFTQLSKSGVIVSSTVPAKAQKMVSFTVTSGEKPGEFLIRAKMAGMVLDTHSLSLNELLDCQAKGETTYSLNDGDLVLNLKITVQMFNGILAQMK